jgi:hypothetical protein
MPSLPSFLTFVHVVGLALAVGAATVKLILLIRTSRDAAFLPAFVATSKPITRLIIVGLILLTASGIGWLLYGYQIGGLLLAKIILVAVIWILGPIIDNVIEPNFIKLAPAPGESPSPAFVKARKRYLAIETLATGLFYVIMVMWMLF